MNISTFFIDLDGTVYDHHNGLWNAISEKMDIYLHEYLGIPLDQVGRLRKHYFESYGTTLRGLQKHHSVDADEYLAFVHDVPLKKFIAPDPDLKAILANLPQSKWIFTNSDRNHAQRVLDALDLLDQFKGIIDVLAMDFHSKPEQAAFEKALEIAGDAPPEACLFADDIPKNLSPARQMGFTTVLVSKESSDPSADICIPRLHELPDALPELLKPNNERGSR